MKRSALFVTMAAVLLTASPGLSQPTASPRVLRELNTVQAEILRRDPSARPYQGYDADNFDPGAQRLARSMSDAQLNAALASYVRMTGVRPGSAAASPTPAPPRPAPVQTPPAAVSRQINAAAPSTPAAALQSKPAGKHEAYCKPFWAEARKDCLLRDRESFSCPIIATNKYEQCLKTGRWY